VKLKLLSLVVCLALVAPASEPDLSWGPQSPDAGTPSRFFRIEVLSLGLALGNEGWSRNWERWGVIRFLTVAGTWERLRLGIGAPELMVITNGGGGYGGGSYEMAPMYDDIMYLPVHVGLTLLSAPREPPEDLFSCCLGGSGGFDGQVAMSPDLYVEVVASPWYESNSEYIQFPVRAALCCDIEYVLGLRAECGFMIHRRALYGGLQLMLGSFSIGRWF